MKAVLTSIHQKWCEKIFNGEKTIEVRKTAPKLETPFTVYVYCTKAKNIREDGLYLLPNDKELYLGCKEKDLGFVCWEGDFRNGKVIGSFVCDKVYKIVPDGEYYSNGYDIDDDMLSETCLGRGYLTGYGLGYTLYGWHIIDPKLFDKPRELGEFYTICNKYGDDSCGDCPYLAVEQCSFPCDDCVDTWCSVDNIKPITRAPQSWCYVEDK